MPELKPSRLQQLRKMFRATNSQMNPNDESPLAYMHRGILYELEKITPDATVVETLFSQIKEAANA